MQGRVKAYNEDRAFGFIMGEDGQDYFFHLSSWKSVAPILRGCEVSFCPGESEKGIIATAITPIEPTTKRPEFIAFGSERIKLNNIKNYGLSLGKVSYVKVYELKSVPIVGHFGRVKFAENCLCWTKDDIVIKDYSDRSTGFSVTYYDEKLQRDKSRNTKFIRTSNGTIRNLTEDDGIIRDENGTVISTGKVSGFFNGKQILADDIYSVEEEYLYVTTYQNTNYQWQKSLAKFDIFEKINELDSYLGVKRN